MSNVAADAHPAEACEAEDPTRRFGLSSDEAARRLRAEGHNELPRPERRTAFRIVLEVLREPMLALLLAGGAIYLALGEPRDALILLSFATMSVAITVVQESRTERVLEALRDLTSPRALVIRDGGPKRIAGRDVVRGDLLRLQEGDRVPADAVLLEADDLHTDESLLTGESIAVRKTAAASFASGPAPRPGGDDLPYVYSGSLIVRGSGVGEVTATGPRSEIGKIGQSLSTLDTEPPRLQAQTRRAVQVFAAGGAAVSVLAVLLYGLLRGGWLDAVLGGIALGMSMLPEEFPVVLTVFMAMGAWRISRAGVLTRRAAAIETLGSATVLCTDKTGTLTRNRMSIAELRLADGRSFLPTPGAMQLEPDFRRLSAFGALACAPEPFDPMEKAFHEFEATHRPSAAVIAGPRPVRGYGLNPDLLAVTNVWQASGASTDFVVASKGAPEAITSLCRLDATTAATVRGMVAAMAGKGLRVLGVAHAAHSAAPLPSTPRGFDFKFVGLVGLADPLRPGVPEAVEQCRTAGIRIVMITGDYPVTAMAVAQQAGLAINEVFTGDDLKGLNDAELAACLRKATVFARIMPEQKLRIVTAFESEGEVVAMTGDGVNDAPSLKAAHIGIAMGVRGTDVAREASSIVLLNDDFGSIVKAIRLGRRIYDNLQKATGFILAVHVPIAGLALLPLAFGLPMIFGPVHIAFLEMVIDPVCSLVFEAETEEADVMRRPPRPPEQPLFSPVLIGWSLLQGALAFALVALVFLLALHRGMPEDEVRALTFFSLVLTIVSLIFVNRSFSASLSAAFRRRNGALAVVLLIVAGVLALSLLWPFASSLFRFGPLHLDDLAITVAAGALVLVILELLKRFWMARGRQRSSAASKRYCRR